MSEPKLPPTSARPAPRRARPSRRGFLGGMLAVSLAAVLLPADRVVTPPRRWTGKARWIGHW